MKSGAVAGYRLAVRSPPIELMIHSLRSLYQKTLIARGNITGVKSPNCLPYYNDLSLIKVPSPSPSHNTPPLMSHFVDFDKASRNLVSSLAAFSFPHSILIGASGANVTV